MNQAREEAERKFPDECVKLPGTASYPQSF